MFPELLDLAPESLGLFLASVEPLYGRLLGKPSCLHLSCRGPRLGLAPEVDVDEEVAELNACTE